MKSPSKIIFHTIEGAIKEYRRFAQRALNEKAGGITVDQALVLLYLDRYPELQQNEIAALIFKDNASLTRMIELMTKKAYLKRSNNEKDRRRSNLVITAKGERVLKTVTAVVAANRKKALQGVTSQELSQLENTLNKVIANCQH